MSHVICLVQDARQQGYVRLGKGYFMRDVGTNKGVRRLMAL